MAPVCKSTSVPAIAGAAVTAVATCEAAVKPPIVVDERTLLVAVVVIAFPPTDVAPAWLSPPLVIRI